MAVASLHVARSCSKGRYLPLHSLLHTLINGDTVFAMRIYTRAIIRRLFAICNPERKRTTPVANIHTYTYPKQKYVPGRGCGCVQPLVVGVRASGA